MTGDASLDIRGQVVVITGAGSGIGRALAVGFAGDGARVAGFERDQHGLAETERAAGGEFLAVAGDATSDADILRLVEQTTARFGAIDVLINNAGIANQGPLLGRPFADWQAVIDVNLIGVARCTYHILPRMLERGHGRVISVASRAAEGAGRGMSAYAASKAGVITFTKAVAKEVDRSAYPDVLVNALIPGPTLSGLMTTGQDPTLVYPHARYVATLPTGGPTGRVFFNSRDYAVYTRFNEG